MRGVYGIRVAYNDRISLGTIKQLVLQLEKLCRKERVVFVSGTGKRKTPLQRYVEQAREYLQRMEDYVYKLDVCGDRNSYSKTDHDATFMRMKEDAMLNGQLKPAYNVQHAVDAGFITWVDVSSRPGDTLTLHPMLKEMEEHLHFKYRDIVADAGYESEENYLYLENNGQASYIKPTNYEISRTRKYKTDIGRRENMSYDKETGQRAGELAALQKSDDLGEYLHVHRQQIKGRDKDGHQIFYDVGYTKDERFHPHDGRLIPITFECRKVLDMAKALPGNSEYIFHDKKGSPIQRDSYIQNLGRRCKRLNINCTHNHAFRVAFNSRLIGLGFSSADRALILGHEVQTNEANYSVTDKRHLADLHKKLTGEVSHTGNKNTKNSVVKEEQ